METNKSNSELSNKYLRKIIEEISRIFSISSEEVIRICRKVLFYFKDKLDSFLNILLNENNPTK